MLSKLSTREKVLLHILLCLVIIAGGIYLLIMPSIAYHTKVKDDFAKVSELRKQVELEVSLLDTRKSSVDSENIKFEKSMATFLEEQPTYDLDEKITKMINNRNLLSINMEINEGAIEEDETQEDQTSTDPVDPADPTTEIEEIKEDTAIGASDELTDIISGADNSEVVEVSQIHTINMKLLVNGAQENAMKLVDDFEKFEYIRVVSVDMGRADTNIVLEIYMI